MRERSCFYGGCLGKGPSSNEDITGPWTVVNLKKDKQQEARRGRGVQQGEARRGEVVEFNRVRRDVVEVVDLNIVRRDVDEV